MPQSSKSIFAVLLSVSLSFAIACNLTGALSGGGATQAPDAPPAPPLPEPQVPETEAPDMTNESTFTFRGIELMYDPSMIMSVEGHIGAGLGCDGISPIPPHIEISLALDSTINNVYEPSIAVFPVQEYVDFCGEGDGPLSSSSVWVNETLDALRQAIDTQSGAPKIPPMPLVNAGEPLRERGRYLTFQNGAGVRAVVSYAHDVWFFHNDVLSYYFQGLTSDGNYYVTVRFPVRAPFLLDGPEPSENTNDLAIPIPEYDVTDFETFIQVVETYNNEAHRLFGVTSDTDFMPDLSALDTLVASLRIEPGPADFTASSGSGECKLTAEQELTIYSRPFADAQVFSTMPAGFEAPIDGVTADGWYGFDPGVAQAANIGVFRLRWIDGSSGVSLAGDCAGVQEFVGPAPGVCFTMPMGDVPVYATPDAATAVITTLTTGDYAAVLGRTAGGWAQVDLSLGNLGLGQTGWIEAATLNMNGPCSELPTLTP